MDGRMEVLSGEEGLLDMVTRSEVDLVIKSSIGTKQKLLAGLSLGIEGSRNLSSTKRSIREKPSVLTRKRHPLRYALVDYINAQFS